MLQSNAMILIIANWKMNPPTIVGAKHLFQAAKSASERLKRIHIIVAPPSLFLRDMVKGYRGKKIGFAVQNVHHERQGSFTGEISASQAHDVGAGYAIVGHAERRALGERNSEVGQKMKLVLAEGMTAILCVGERERDQSGEYLAFVNEQLRSGLEHVTKKQLKNLIIAYEPVWAIGAKEAMKPRQMHEMAIFIRKFLNQQYGSVALSVPILYGGSVDAGNAAEMIIEGDVQGLLVGRASANAQTFTELLRSLF